MTTTRHRGQTSEAERAQASDFQDHGIHVTRSYTINRSARDLYTFWRSLENLPTFMTHLESITLLGNGRSHWRVKGPLGAELEWDAEIINEEPDRLIAWRSIEGSGISNAGSVRFEETPDRGTQVHVSMEYIPRGGKLGAAVAKLFGDDPAHQLKEDLRKFKQLMEAGEIATPESPRGTCNSKGKAQ